MRVMNSRLKRWTAAYKAFFLAHNVEDEKMIFSERRLKSLCWHSTYTSHISVHMLVPFYYTYIHTYIYADIYFPDIPCYFLLYALCGSPQFNCYLRLRVFIQTSNAFIKGANAERNVKGQSSTQNERNGWKHYRSNDLEASKLQHDILDWKC